VGAWEVAARYSHTKPQQPRDHGLPTTVTGGTFGGVQDIMQIGLNWYRPQCPLSCSTTFSPTSTSSPPTVSPTQGQKFQAVALRTQVNW